MDLAGEHVQARYVEFEDGATPVSLGFVERDHEMITAVVVMSSFAWPQQTGDGVYTCSIRHDEVDAAARRDDFQ